MSGKLRPSKERKLQLVKDLKRGALPANQTAAVLATLTKAQQINLSHDFHCECGTRHASAADNLEWCHLDDQRQLYPGELLIVNKECPNLIGRTFIVIMTSDHLMAGYFKTDAKGGDAR